ncbi:uncharacterized protein LOC144624464 [Crassostrea virginica]
MAGMVLLVCFSWAVLLCLSVQAYENLALHQPASQSSTYWYYIGAERAVDGEYTNLTWDGGQCAASTYGQTTAEWRVDLEGVRKNLALHQPAWQSSTLWSDSGAERAVDRLYTNLTWYGGQCAMSVRGQTTAEWRVDLGGVRSIHHIVIQYMTDNRVWGCPSRGYYGEHCSLECPQNCQDGYCDIVEGTCFGCAHRYMGPRCTQDCKEGLYGSYCSQNCSMTCGDPGRCDIMTGHCNGGCQVGWTGAMCEKGYQLTIYNTHKNVYILKPSYISKFYG